MLVEEKFSGYHASSTIDPVQFAGCNVMDLIERDRCHVYKLSDSVGISSTKKTMTVEKFRSKAYEL